ncbi:hypothetical protein [Dyella japonica]|uniref:Uncharacterized protein n=1 Tax=Dyella japonica A8 TaxID=1217721 RepID=A0A075JZ77_9GAMM|nr:hypothetical protein [Dyella japonica]AIF46865.1 hypothetical protein HY57_06095 [Dyella japonica A8]
MKRKLWLPVAVAMMVLQVATVQAKETKPDVKANTKDEFAAVADHVRQQMGPGGRFENVDKDDQATVNRDLSNMSSLYDKFGTVDAMDQSTKVELYNNQSEVNAILTRHDADREVCEQVKPMGSNIPKTVCRTQRQIDQENGSAQRFMQDQSQRTQLKGGH